VPFTVCYYHVVWSTEGRAPLIDTAIEACILETIARKSAALKTDLWAINCVEDHIHIAASIALTVAVADWVKQVKGLSAFEVNQRWPSLNGHFRWQKSYGILTFGAKNLPFVVDYIQQQKEHHANAQLVSYLEQMGEE
jgi:putative transposase